MVEYKSPALPILRSLGVLGCWGLGVLGLRGLGFRGLGFWGLG